MMFVSVFSCYKIVRYDYWISLQAFSKFPKMTELHRASHINMENFPTFDHFWYNSLCFTTLLLPYFDESPKYSQQNSLLLG